MFISYHDPIAITILLSCDNNHGVFFALFPLLLFADDSLFGYNPGKFLVLHVPQNVFSCTCWLAFTLKQMVTTAVYQLTDLIAYKVPNKLMYSLEENYKEPLQS